LFIVGSFTDHHIPQKASETFVRSPWGSVDEGLALSAGAVCPRFPPDRARCADSLDDPGVRPWADELLPF